MVPDHNQVSELVFRCSVISNSAGVQVGDTAATRQMGIFGFEPHQTELSRYRPGCFINITLGEEGLRLGRYYCWVDQAKYAAYGKGYRCLHDKNTMDGDDCCGAGKPPGGGAPPVPAGYPPKPRPV